jgi:biopolymer transport protein ExbB/TolQ
VDTYFNHYVLNGGWAMLLLIPASVVTVAALLRGWLILRQSALSPLDKNRTASAIVARLQAIADDHKRITPDDVRAEISNETLNLYAALQPLVAMYVLAPLAGVLGAVTKLMAAYSDIASGLSPEALASLTESALVPVMWGVAIAAVAYAAFATLRARLFYIETRIIRPQVEAAATELLRAPVPLRRTPSTSSSIGEEDLR